MTMSVPFSIIGHYHEGLASQKDQLGKSMNQDSGGGKHYVDPAFCVDGMSDQRSRTHNFF